MAIATAFIVVWTLRVTGAETKTADCDQFLTREFELRCGAVTGALQRNMYCDA